MFTTTKKILFRKEFKKASPGKEILTRYKNSFTREYVDWLERELHSSREKVEIYEGHLKE